MSEEYGQYLLINLDSQERWTKEEAECVLAGSGVGGVHQAASRVEAKDDEAQG